MDTVKTHKDCHTVVDLHRRVEADRDLLQEHIVRAEAEAPATTATLSSYRGCSMHEVLEAVSMLDAD